MAQGGGTGKLSEELLLLQHYIEIHSLCVLINQTTQKLFSAFSYCDPIWTSCVLAGELNQMLFTRRFEPFSWALCVYVKVFNALILRAFAL